MTNRATNRQRHSANDVVYLGSPFRGPQICPVSVPWPPNK